jgi:hypothetical protein
MHETRRKFVTALAVTAGSLIAWRGVLFAQRPITPPPPPAPAETQPPEDNSRVPGIEAARRELLRRNEKEFREGVERLYQLTGELREEVQKTPTAGVLSVHLYKKTEEIEKLAKQLKNKARG